MDVNYYNRGGNMDILFWVLLGFVAYLFISRMMPVKGIKTISTNDLKNIIKQKDKQFIDVRTPGEYQSNHIKQFKNMPLHQLKQTAQTLDKTKETYVICQSGMRSMQAAKILKKAGFSNITNVTGGMNAWR